LEATTVYNVHSPFVFKLVRHLFTGGIPKYLTEMYDVQRKAYLTSDFEIPNQDLGAGSNALPASSFIKIKDIASTAMSGKYKLRLLYLLSEYFSPDLTLELGTSLGMSAAHLACHSKQVITIEGNPAIADQAALLFLRLEIGNIQCIRDNFDAALQYVLPRYRPDLVYIDGNHTYEATIRYFKLFLDQCLTEKLVLIFDDIYWSEGMYKAWDEIKNHEKVTLTIDLYHLGIVLFTPEIIAPRHYKLVPYGMKPWHLGFRPVSN